MTFLTGVSAIVCLVLFLHPFVTYPISLQIATRLKWRKIPASQVFASNIEYQKFSVCMCAYNEERVISAKALNLLEIVQQFPGSEILIYIDGNSDRTEELLHPYRDRFTIICGEGRRGKTHGMKLLVEKAKNDLVLFTDANIHVDVKSLANLERYFADGSVGCVGGRLTYEDIQSATGSSNAAYRGLEEKLNRLESGLGSALVADGSLFAIRRELYNPPPDDLIDDMFVSLSVLCAGSRVIQADDVFVYEQSVSVQHEEFRRKIRIACQSMNVHRLLWPRIRALDWPIRYRYVSHKLLRWLGIVPLIAAYLFVLVFLSGKGWWILFAIVMFGPALAWALSYALPKSIFAKLWSIFLAILATGIGVLKSIGGERFQTWEPVKSIRSES